MTSKPFSQACENNKEPILSVLKKLFPQTTEILEVASGTGQHAVHFCQQLPHVHWQPTDLANNLEGIQLWREEANLNNLEAPIELDATAQHWPLESVALTAIDAIYTANSCHIMGWDEVQLFLSNAGNMLKPDGYLCIYGPFNYPDENGICRFTSESNASFDQWLKEQDPKSGIRDITEMNRVASEAGLIQIEDNEMPANNRLVVWRKRKTPLL